VAVDLVETWHLSVFVGSATTIGMAAATSITSPVAGSSWGWVEPSAQIEPEHGIAFVQS
jgi:hypothetical protein